MFLENGRTCCSDWCEGYAKIVNRWLEIMESTQDAGFMVNEAIKVRGGA